MVDASEGALRVLQATECRGLTYEDIYEAMHHRFDSVPVQVPERSAEYEENAGEARLIMDRQDDCLAMSIQDELAGTADRHLAHVFQAEFGPIKAIAEAAPGLVWKVSPDQKVVWSNQAYRELSLQMNVSPKVACPFFGELEFADKPVRAKLLNHEEHQPWYEIQRIEQSDGMLYFAANIEMIVHAESAQRNFVQTLSKTFAHLPIGLAIFDRNRQLVLINPALVDLTSLPPEFLSTGPNLMTFFDYLREARMMPEPKNYNSWREKLADVVKAAADDRYSETWTLPSGLTYKITGRPHPDGAVAFLIEDISSEITLTRRFRAELSRTQSVLDTMPEAVAVFSEVGELKLCNAAYRSLWTTKTSPKGQDVMFADEIDRWQAETAETSVWREIAQKVRGGADRQECHFQICHKLKGPVMIYVAPIPGGATLVRFEVDTPVADIGELKKLAGS